GWHIPRVLEFGVEMGLQSARLYKKVSLSYILVLVFLSPSRRLYGLSLENNGLITRDLNIGDN
ncbi:hypothetical protein BGZ61DRAFT_376157, partial [Ilyonectria robusta]|uniref:uncharacterized protein n=1 Tax=Ilyonectria robusta TaxID=1079257 RepID=UPI001E8EE681